ncbi:hypothetical protein GFY24_39945 [Nocardia sp. SYP-A9097]|uniref:hypothetical protein n=1 Tax=Nocardia sp. SYP-A9097 TaxID=2663237 RepID=UPI00129ABD42|nr:hypothetical protein [Nocardia sp. SYP-A9097]MRH93506.1 hypothetical protein [Nocardia sp. SYP-A9097]
MSTSPQNTTRSPTLHHLSTPRAAALAGIAFTVLFGTTLTLIFLEMPVGLQNSTQWLENKHTAIRTATVLMPFAGISFLWFIGVVRDGFGRYEDRFFSSVFLGSGLLFLAMMFVATAVAAGLVDSNTEVTDLAARAEVINFGAHFLVSATQTYALRMAAVFMISLATIWLKTRLMPRWLAILSYLLAMALLIASDMSKWVEMVFPAWVLVVSGLILARHGLIEQLRTHRD